VDNGMLFLDVLTIYVRLGSHTKLLRLFTMSL